MVLMNYGLFLPGFDMFLYWYKAMDMSNHMGYGGHWGGPLDTKSFGPPPKIQQNMALTRGYRRIFGLPIPTHPTP